MRSALAAALLLGFAQIERENINERIRAGVAAARKRGVKFGRPAWKTRPYRRTAFTVARLSRTVTAVGFSQYTSLPAWQA